MSRTSFWLVSSLLIVACGLPPDDYYQPRGAGQQQSAAAIATPPPPGPDATAQVVAEKELFVTDLSVVNDPELTAYAPNQWDRASAGGFSFGRLIDNLDPVDHPSDLERARFVLAWLRSFESPQLVNAQIIQARPAIRSIVITPWKLASVGRNGNTAADCTDDPASDGTCKLSFDSDVLPFRLLAVVYRPDLRVIPDKGVDGMAGQGRFVFGVLDALRNPLLFTVIFEFMIPAKNANDIRKVAQGYAGLRGEPWGPSFNQKLHDRTNEFASRGAGKGRVNGSALLQLRTNEVSLSPLGADPTNPRTQLWELRQFELGASGDLLPAPVTSEPDIALDNTPALGAWAAANSAAILDGTAIVPASFQSAPFLAASAPVPFSFKWEVPGVTEDVRAAFALNTCNGCHRAETSTVFLHVKGRRPDVSSVLSPFLLGQLDASGPRVADYLTVLNTPPGQLKKGKGKGK